MPRLDQDTIAMLKEVMDDEFTLLLDTFFDDSAGRLEEMQQAIHQADGEAFRRAAHSFKGSAGNLAAQDLAYLCQLGEAAGQAGDLPRCAELLTQMQQEYAELEPLLRAMR